MTTPPLTTRPLGRTGLQVSPVAFGAFKIGRNTKVKYPGSYDLPDEPEVARLLDEVAELGINLLDTAPSYGTSEERLGRYLATRDHRFLLCSKFGETFVDGQSTWTYTRDAILRSVEGSLQRLQTDSLDILLIHSSGDDLDILQRSDAVPVLHRLREEGTVRAIGFSGKTVPGAMLALEWADVLMLEYHLQDTSHLPVLQEATRRGTGILVKKGLAAGHLPPEQAIRFVLAQPAVHSLVLGSLNAAHLRDNAAIARTVGARRDVA